MLIKFLDFDNEVFYNWSLLNVLLKQWDVNLAAKNSEAFSFEVF